MPEKQTDQLVRRDFLKRSAAAGALLAAGGGTTAHAAALPRPRTGRARPVRNIIFMVSDGMSAGTLTLADMYLTMHRDRPTHWVSLWKEPGVRRSMCATFSANALVTDSAAAASAWSIGERVNNGAVCFTPDEREPAPILVRARERGLATGLVTTTRITHATPAAFIANVPRRSMEDQIAAQLLERKVDVALGGGARHFPDEALDEADDLHIIRSRRELLDLGDPAPSRLLGLFSSSHMSYDIERPAEEPSLAEMTRAALEILPRRGDGFIVQIEGGRVDHAAHANDAASLIHDQLAFDDAIGVAAEFTHGRDDTLLIITSDHGNANPGLTLYGPRGIQAFERLAAAKHSFSWINSQLRGDRTPEALAEALPAVVNEATGIELTDEQRDTVIGVLRGESAHPFAPSDRFYPVLGATLANHFGVAFASPNHTSDFVEVTALGAGSEHLPPVTALADVFTLMARAAAIA